MKHLLLLSLLWMSVNLYGQKNTVVKGKVFNIVSSENLKNGTISIEPMGDSGTIGSDGRFEIILGYDANLTNIIIEVSAVGYEEYVSSHTIVPGKKNEFNLFITPEEGAAVTDTVIIKSSDGNQLDGTTIDENSLSTAPNTTGDIGGMVPAFGLGADPGTGGELSSQYSVRGGNYDENLIYVNDFRIYKPLLISSSTQEGFTFPNPALTESLIFSSGGFGSHYGDIMSSIMDVRYGVPTEFKGSAEASFLGGAFHIENFIDKRKDSLLGFSYQLGARYKTTKFLLNSLDVEVEYLPIFYDIQGLLTYDVNESWRLELIGNMAFNKFDFSPSSRDKTLGLTLNPLNFSADFSGSEEDQFKNQMVGFSAINRNYDKALTSKFLVSYFHSNEHENFDITSNYTLSEFSNITQQDTIIGQGINNVQADNKLDMSIIQFGYLGSKIHSINTSIPFERKEQSLDWSLRANYEILENDIFDYDRLDSIDSDTSNTAYTISENTVHATNDFNSFRTTAHVQNTWTSKDTVRETNLVLGVRGSYWEYNNEFIVSPRVGYIITPQKNNAANSFKVAGGLYMQQPLFREAISPAGIINQDIKAQKSAHGVLGYSHKFSMGDRPFLLISEVYYKHLWDVISYDIENVKIQYSGENDLTGYAIGWDTRLNGEFIKGLESYLNLSLLRSREQLNDIQHTDSDGNIDDVPRPTDQLVKFSMLFQDELPKNENFKVHLNLFFASGLPFGNPEANIISRNQFRYSPYQRVDIGFSAQLWDQAWLSEKVNNPFKGFQKVWLSAEIFNLFDNQNTNSNTWVTTYEGSSYAIPNNLTSRRLNLRLKADF